MSSPACSRQRNYLKPFAAFVLQNSAAVRSLAFVFVALLALPAQAQTGTCMGGTSPNALMGTVGIAVDSSGNNSVQAASVPFVFNGAECQCAGNDNGDQPLLLDIMLTATFQPGQTGTVQLWYGAACDTNNMSRQPMFSTICEQDNSTNITFSTFVTGSTGSHIYVPVNAKALFSPTTHVCPTSQTQNGIFLLFFFGNMSALSGSPYATCTLNTTQQVAGPGAPTNLQAASGDSAVSLTWGAPSAVLPQPQFYQVLCADEDGNPVSGSPPVNIYSTCSPAGGLERRHLDIGGSISAVGDGGTTTMSQPFGTSSLPPPAAPQATADGGTDDGGTDGGAPVGSGLPPPFDFLDKKFVCSDGIPLGTGGGSVRVGGLTNGKVYKFVVLGVDQYGNPTPNVAANGMPTIVTATPQPVEDLYRRYRDAGGGGSGFCFIATAAYGSYQHPFVEILRQFRDEVLLPTHSGTRFVDWYYAHSPPAAAYISAHPLARTATRIGLWPVIGFAAAWLYVPLWAKWLLVVAFAAFVWRRRLRMRRA
jgi:hypothetical protein